MSTTHPLASPPVPLDLHLPRPEHDPTWRQRAVCAGSGLSGWIDLPPIRVRGRDNPAYDIAKADKSAICMTCEVRDHCLWSALTTDVSGIFAATDEYDRADIRDLLDLPEPDPVTPPDSDEDQRLRTRNFAIRRGARTGQSNKELAAAFEVSVMTVTRALTD